MKSKPLSMALMALGPLFSAVAGQENTPPPPQAVVHLVEQIRRADYEGDRPGLARLRTQLAPDTQDKKLESRIRYWRGFALWRRALNGFNDAVDSKELEQDLKEAIDEFEQSLAADPGFVDAKVGEISCLLNLVFIHRNDGARVRELLQRAVPLLKEAQEAEPENPRLLWVLGSSQFYRSVEQGGGQVKGMETYKKGLEGSRKQKTNSTDSLEPSWGEPELLMNLAWSNLNATTPDVAAADQYAQAALKLVPYWHYVRDILWPQIREAKTRASKP